MGAEHSALTPRPRYAQPMPQSVRNMHVAVMQNDVPRLRSLLASGCIRSVLAYQSLFLRAFQITLQVSM